MSDCPDCRCSEFDKCFKVLNLMLDDEASPEQEEYFFRHIAKCTTCFNHYSVEMKIRELLRTRLKKKIIPSEMILEIRNKIVE